jgi:replication factor C subunit 3/5
MWTEKYRPRNFRDLICNEDSIFTLYKLQKKIVIYNIIIFGPSGIGKISSFYSFLNELIIQKDNYHLIELSGVDEYKVKNTNEIISDFLFMNFSKEKKKKIIIIKDSDYLPFQSQLCLRKYLENLSPFFNFWLVCKFIFKINTAISSRCVRILLKKQGFLQPTVRIKEIFDKENILIFLETLEKFISLGNFNFRLILNLLTEYFIFNFNPIIKSFIIGKYFISKYKENYSKDYFFKDKEYTCFRKTFYYDCKNRNTKLKNIKKNKNWFYSNNSNIIFE